MIFSRFNKLLLTSFASVISCSYCTAQKADTLNIYFGLGSDKLNEQAMQKIDSLFYYEQLKPGKKLGILGYADYVGDSLSNQKLSEARAENVRQYLLASGFRQQDIQVVLGYGEISREIAGVNGFAPDRRVAIIPGGIKIPKPKPLPPPQPKPELIDISQTKKNSTLALNNIFFFPGSNKTRPESEPAMKKLYETMKANPNLRIRIEGHICCLTHSNFDGYDYDNQDFHLSLNRARTIYDYLIAKGIDPARLQYKGLGNTKPLAKPELTEEDENKNRRVEIRILNK